MWTKYNEKFDFDSKDNNSTWDAIVNYMDDDKREAVHFELAPCTKTEFINRYIELDPDFEDLLDFEFSIVNN